MTGATRYRTIHRLEELGKAGAKVAICSHKADALRRNRSRPGAKRHRGARHALATCRAEELQALVDATRARWGRIDIVVANAATNPYYGPLTGIGDEAFDKIFANNLKSVLWLAGMTLPGMSAGGSFILVGSIGGIIANTVMEAYGMSKAAGHHLVQPGGGMGAEEHDARERDRPAGLIKTEFARALWEGPQARRRLRFKHTTAAPRRAARHRRHRRLSYVACCRLSPGQCIVAGGGVTIL